MGRALFLFANEQRGSIGSSTPLDEARSFSLNPFYGDDLATSTMPALAITPRHAALVLLREWSVAGSWVIEATTGAFERWGLSVGDVVEVRDGE